MSDAEGPLAIVAGGGSVPIAVAEAVMRRGRRVVLFPVRGWADPAAVERFPHYWIAAGQGGRLARQVGIGAGQPLREGRAGSAQIRGGIAEKVRAGGQGDGGAAQHGKRGKAGSRETHDEIPHGRGGPGPAAWLAEVSYSLPPSLEKARKAGVRRNDRPWPGRPGPGKARNLARSVQFVDGHCGPVTSC